MNKQCFWMEGFGICFGSDNSNINWSEMRVANAWKWVQKDSVELAVFAAELVIDIFERKYPNNKRPRKALKAAKAWLKNPNAITASVAYTAQSFAYATNAICGNNPNACYAANAAYAAASAAYSAHITKTDPNLDYVSDASGDAAFAVIVASKAINATTLNKCKRFVLDRIKATDKARSA